MTPVRRLKQRANRNSMKSFAGGDAQRFGELQIVMGKVWRDMPQIACEPRQRGLWLGTPAVALAQCFHGKAMAEIVNPGSSAMMTEDAGALTSANRRWSSSPRRSPQQYNSIHASRVVGRRKEFCQPTFNVAVLNNIRATSAFVSRKGA